MQINFCGVCGNPNVNALCERCLRQWQKERKDHDKEELKLFQVRVYSQGPNPYGPDRELIDIVVILARDLESAYSHCDYEDELVDLEGVEILGPFKSGFILSDWK